MTDSALPGIVDDDWLHAHSQLLAASYQRLTGNKLLAESGSSESLAQALYAAPFALVSHDTRADPVFNYANLTAQRLFALDWSGFTRLPSRCSAEPVNREERARLMAQVSEQGYIDNYRGLRIAASGQRFWIEQATVWNVSDDQGHYRGQAARFHHWQIMTDS